MSDYYVMAAFHELDKEAKFRDKFNISTCLYGFESKEKMAKFKRIMDKVYSRC